MPTTVTRRFIMQKARRHMLACSDACRRTVSGTISLPCSGFFSPFPHGTGSLSVSYEYLALADGPAGFTQDFTCPALLRIPLRFRSLRTWGFHPLWPYFPACHPHSLLAMTWSYNPIMALLPQWFGLFPVRSPLLGESLLFSFPAGTKMFQFPALAYRLAV